MKIFNEMLEIFDKQNEFIETKNFYFETHDCNGETVKVQMDYTIESENSGDSIVFGKCPKCNKVFYSVN